MSTSISKWTLSRLARIAETDAERADRLLEALWSAHPCLLSELAIAAVQAEELSVEDCAKTLEISEEDVEDRVLAERVGSASLILVDGGVAKLADARVCVWEIIRELRRNGSLEALCQTYPGLTRSELEAALAYAEANSDEIQDLIERYETRLGRKKAEYPYA